MAIQKVKSVNDSTKNKEEISMILQDGNDWVDVNDQLPELPEVVIRMYNPDIIISEDDKSYMPVEEYAIASYMKGYNDPNDCKWIISGPYPKYNFSPLWNGNEINEDTIISHWREASEDELAGWASRLSFNNNYEKLRIEIDNEHEEDLYRALSLAAGSINSAHMNEVRGINALIKEKEDKIKEFITKGEIAINKEDIETIQGEIKYLNEKKENSRLAGLSLIMYDLQACIDRNSYIENSTEKRLESDEDDTYDIVDSITLIYQNIMNHNSFHPLLSDVMYDKLIDCIRVLYKDPMIRVNTVKKSIVSLLDLVSETVKRLSKVDLEDNEDNKLFIRALSAGIDLIDSYGKELINKSQDSQYTDVKGGIGNLNNVKLDKINDSPVYFILDLPINDSIIFPYTREEVEDMNEAVLENTLNIALKEYVQSNPDFSQEEIDAIMNPKYLEKLMYQFEKYMISPKEN